MKRKMIFIAVVLSVFVAVVYMPQKAYASSEPYRFVGLDPVKIGNYYYRLEANADYDVSDFSSWLGLYRSKYKNKGYKRVSKSIDISLFDQTCAVNGKYCYALKQSDDGSSIVRYSVSKKGKKVVKKLSDSMWITAAKGNMLFLQGSGIYSYNIANGKLKKIKKNGSVAAGLGKIGLVTQNKDFVIIKENPKAKKPTHTLYKVTNSGKLKKIKKLGKVHYNVSDYIWSDYYFVGKKLYYMLDGDKSFVLKRCNLNGSNVETLGVFDKVNGQEFFRMRECTSKSCVISYSLNETDYTYKYDYKTKKMTLRAPY